MKRETAFSLTGAAAVAAAVLAVLVILTIPFGPSAVVTEDTHPEVRLLDASKAPVGFEFRPPAGSRGVLEAELCDARGNVLARYLHAHTGRPVRILMFTAVDPDNLADYTLRYRFAAAAPFQRRSLHLMKGS